MNVLDVLYSRGMFFLVLLLVLVDCLIIFVAKGFVSFIALGVLEAIFIFYYIVARSLTNVDSRVWFLKK